MENSIITFLYVLLVVAYLSGCAYNGDVNLYSPKGDDNIISKAVSTSAEIPVLP
jgi:hypothetical protein